MKKSYVGAIIADIHAGAFDGKILYDELMKGFIKYIKSIQPLDFVIIAGDLFDTKISLNSDHTKYIFSFLKSLMTICVEKNTKLRIIKGTESHDNQQLQVLNYLTGSNCDIRIISHVESEQLFEDMKVLYIPEEYMKDKDEFYKDYMDDNYDMIFGHGLVDEVAFCAKKQESEVTMSKAPIFQTKKLLSICKGPIFFGHIHKPQNIQDRMFYVGSYSRWVFGEEEPKGFMSVVYTPETGAFETEFIKNKHCRTYDTITVGYDSNLYNTDQNESMKQILSLVEMSNADKLRIIFNIPEDYPNSTLLVSLINNVFNNHKNLKVIVNNNAKEMRKKKEVEDKIQALMSTYDFIFDKGVPPEDKLSRYIKIKYNKDIPVERVRNYLFQKINTMD